MTIRTGYFSDCLILLYINAKIQMIEKEVFMFNLVSKYKPSGDQPNAIDELVKGLNEGKKNKYF